jgi:diguanylate cyclase (GGDEF)-like protein
MEPADNGPAIERALSGQGWSVALAADARAAAQRLAKAPVDIAIVPEGRTPRATVALLRRLAAATPALRRIVLLHQADPQALLAYANEGGAHCLLKPPHSTGTLVRTVREQWGRQQAERKAWLELGDHGQALAELRALMEERAAELSRANRELRRALREIARKNKALTVLNESLRVQSTTDALTGLYNRREFLNRIRTEWGRFKRYARPLSLIMLDIDRFKRVNDTHGHECGDVVLRELGYLIGRNKRAQDLCCRYGGEEFVVLLAESTLDAAFHVAEGLRQLVADHRFEYEGQRIPVHVSLGVSGAVEQQPRDVEAFINLADKAMYRAKRQGRNRTVVLDAADESRIALESREEPAPERPPLRVEAPERRKRPRSAARKR